MTRAGFLAVPFLLLACGGEDGPGPDIQDNPTGRINCSATDDLELELIADFEANATGWSVNTDGTAVIPSADPERPEIPGGRCGSLFALHIYGGPYTDYGGGLYHGTNATNPETNLPEGIDASAWDGVVFWGRAETSSHKQLRLDLSDVNTDDGRNNTTQYQGEPNPDGCTPGAPENGPALGCDKFGSFAVLGQNWQAFVLDFDEMRQAGWGLQQERFAIEDLWSLNFSYAQGYWDFWIDDVSFFRRKR